MVDVSVGKDSITIKIEGTKKFFALKSKIEIPLDNIAKISTEQVKPVWLPRGELERISREDLWLEPFD